MELVRTQTHPPEITVDEQALFRQEAERCEAVVDALKNEPATPENAELLKTADVFARAFRLIVDHPTPPTGAKSCTPS